MVGDKGVADWSDWDAVGKIMFFEYNLVVKYAVNSLKLGLG